MVKLCTSSVVAIFTFVIGTIFLLPVTSQPLARKTEFKKLCLIFAIPGIKNGPVLDLFKRKFEMQLDKVGISVFGNIPHNDRMKKSENCTALDSSSPKCAYNRIATIYSYLLKDLTTLQNQLGTRPQDAPYLYTALLSAWYLDRVFLAIDCGPVDIKTEIPVVQFNFIAKWSHHLQSRDKFCTWSRPLGKSAAKNLRQEVSSICGLREGEPICKLGPIFDMVDTLENLCRLVSADQWKTQTGNFPFFENAAYISFYSMRLKAPIHIANTFHERTEQQPIKQAILDIFVKMYEDFRNADLTLIEQLLEVLPKSMYLPCDFTAQFPSFEWSVCAISKAFTELRVFIETRSYGTVQKRKFLISNVDYGDFIQKLKTSQIKELSEKQSISLDAAVVAIKNNVQERFQQLGTYFRKVATYEQKKVSADIDYLNGRIDMYKQRFGQYTKDLSLKMKKLFTIFIGTALEDVLQAVLKMVIRMAEAANPLKWIFGSGNADEVLESATEIADASLLLTKAIKSTVNFKKLVNYNTELEKKLMKNKKMIKAIGNVLKDVDKSVNSTANQFEKHQSEFLENYKNYSPQVSKDDLEKLDSYWDLFIDEVCDGISSTSSIAATAIKGIKGSSGLCMEAKRTAAQLVACQEEIYDLQFELIEAMASLVHSLTQIQSSKILGSGTKATHPSGLGREAIKTLVAVSSMSYKIMQMTNVQMLCNILEYKHGKMPNACTGLSTDIDKLTSLKEPLCHPELHYLSVPSKPHSNNSNDRSWLDLSKLYKGEIVQFQIPNSDWLSDHLHLLPSQINNSFYVSGMEIYVPVVSKHYRTILVTVTPTNTNNKLYSHSLTNYVIEPVEPMKIKYAEGSNTACRQTPFSNPYSKCGNQERTMPRICPHSIGTETEVKNRLFPSIYSQFNIQLEGYESMKLDVPVTNVPVKMGLKYCSVDASTQYGRKKRTKFRGVRKTSDRSCCPEQHYFVERTNQCKRCPPGSRDFYNGLFCGETIKVLITPDYNKNTEFTYDDAVHLCQDKGSRIASSTDLKNAKNLGTNTCQCGWIAGNTIDSINQRSECDNKVCPASREIKFVYCTMVFEEQSSSSA